MDIEITDHGTIATFALLTEAAVDWWAENVESVDWCDSTLVGHRCVNPILFGLAEAGLTFEVL